MIYGTAWRWRSWNTITISRRSAHCSGMHVIDTTQVYASIRPPQLKRAVAFYEQKAGELLAE
jgi:hypothetical protein